MVVGWERRVNFQARPPLRPLRSPPPRWRASPSGFSEALALAAPSLQMKRFCELGAHPDRQRALVEKRCPCLECHPRAPSRVCRLHARIHGVAARRSAYVFTAAGAFAMAGRLLRRRRRPRGRSERVGEGGEVVVRLERLGGRTRQVAMSARTRAAHHARWAAVVLGATRVAAAGIARRRPRTSAPLFRLFRPRNLRLARRGGSRQEEERAKSGGNDGLGDAAPPHARGEKQSTTMTPDDDALRRSRRDRRLIGRRQLQRRRRSRSRSRRPLRTRRCSRSSWRRRWRSSSS